MGALDDLPLQSPDASPTRDTAAWRRHVDSFVATHIAPHVDTWEREGAYPAALHQQAAQAGLLSLGRPPDTLPHDPAAHAALVESLALAGSQALVMGLASHGVSLLTVHEGHPTLADEVVPAVLRGERAVVLAVTEPQAGSDLRGLATTARHQADDRYLLTGDKAFVCNGARADWLVVAALHGPGGGLGLFLADGRAAGLQATPVSCLGWRALPIAHVRLADVPARRIDLAKPASILLQRALERERLNLAVMAQASSRLALRLTVAHARTRRIGQGTLLDKGETKARLAALRAEWELTQHYVAQSIQSCADERLKPAQAAIAKNAATELFERIARDAVQLHGAHGCVEPAVVERLYRDAKLLSIGGGAREVLLGLVARTLTEETF